MATIKFDFARRTVDEKLMLSQAAITGCTNNPHLPDANPPKAVELAARRYRLAVARANVVSARAALAAVISEKDDAEDAVDEGYSDLGNYVQDETGGDATKILITTYAVASDNTAPIALVAPDHFVVTIGNEDGEINVDWDNVPGARGYETEYTTYLTGATGWGNRKFSTPSKQDIRNLTSGTKYLVRVRALGTFGEGPWTAAVQRRAPSGECPISSLLFLL